MFDIPPMFGGGDNIWDEPDIVLQYIVTALVNGMGLEISVTLMARGLVISGTLTSEAAYLDRISNMLREQVAFTDPEMPPEIKESLQQILDLRSLSEFDITNFIPRSVIEKMEADLEDGDTADVDGNDEDDIDYDDMDFDEDDFPMTLQYLHLKDPVIVAGDPPINFGEGSDVIIRLRLTSIDGWMIGRIMPDVSDYFNSLNGDNDVQH